MKRLIFQGLIFIAVCLMCQGHFLSPASAMPPEEVVKAAEEGKDAFLRGAQAAGIPSLDFSSQEDIDAASIGEGFQVFTVHPDNLLDEAASQDLGAMAEPTPIYQFLVMAEGKAVALLTVDLVDGKPTAVSVGASGLAGQLSQVLQAYPASAGYELRLIRIYQATSDIVEVSQAGRAMGFLPLTSATVSLALEGKDFAPQALQSSSDLLPRLRPVVKKNLELSAQ